MGIAAILMAALAVQDDTGEQFFKFKKDTLWTYEDRKSVV